MIPNRGVSPFALTHQTQLAAWSGPHGDFCHPRTLMLSLASNGVLETKSSLIAL